MTAALKRSVVVELAALAAAALLFVATFRVRPPYLDFALAILAVALVAATARRSASLWQLAATPAPHATERAALTMSIFTAIALVGLAGLAVATARGDARAPFANWHYWVAVPLYFLWALVQQYIFQVYLLGRLLRVTAPRIAIAITAVAFACVHFPRWPVIAATFCAGLFWAWHYARFRRLWMVAVSHGVLGASLHYWVFGRDLLLRWLPL